MLKGILNTEVAPSLWLFQMAKPRIYIHIDWNSPAPQMKKKKPTNKNKPYKTEKMPQKPQNGNKTNMHPKEGGDGPQPTHSNPKDKNPRIFIP